MGSPNLNYAEAKVVLARVANVANQQPLGIRRLTEMEILPITPILMFIGLKRVVGEILELKAENIIKSKKFADDLVQGWWRGWLSRCSVA